MEETPPSDYQSSGEDDDEETPETARSAKRFSNESSESSRKSDKIRMTPSIRYPALINSTVVAGGAPFSKEPLSMSPILGEKDPSSRVRATPLTPAPFNRKPIRAVSQSPMFMNVMHKTITKTVQEQRLATPSAAPSHKSATPSFVPSRRSATPSAAPSSKSVGRPSEGSRNLATPKNVSTSKGSSTLNPGKGKSLAFSALNEIPESSDTEWEDLEDDPKVKPLSIKIAFEVSLNNSCHVFLFFFSKGLFSNPPFLGN